MNWNKVKIGSFLKERQGRFKPSEANTMGLKRVEKIDFSGRYYLAEKPTNTDMIIVKKGDLLISGINAEKGAVTVYDDDEDALATIHYSSYEFDKKKIDVEYFRWFLISDAFKNLLKESAGSGIKTELKSKHLLPLEVYLSNLDIQKDIVETIKLRHKKVTSLQKTIEEQRTYFQQLHQVILQEAVQGKLTEPDPADEPASKLLDRIKIKKQKLVSEGKLKKEKELAPITENEIPFELAKGWVWCRLGEIGNAIDGSIIDGPFGTSVDVKKDYIEEGIPVIRMMNIKPYNFITDELKFVSERKFEELKRYSIKPKDILFSKVGAGIGESCIVPDTFELGMISTTGVTRFRVGQIVLPEFLCHFLNSYKKEFVRIASTTAQPFLNMSTIKNVLFPLPPLSEQQRIITKVQELLQMVNQSGQQVQQSQTQAQQLLQAVLKEAFSNKAKELEENKLSTVAVEG